MRPALSVIAYIFVDDADASRIARRLESFAGSMTRREDGAFHGSKRSVVVRSNRRMAEGFEKFASVVHVYEGATEAQIRENGLVVFNLLKGFGDVELAATFDLEELLDTFTPKHDAA